MPGLVAQLDARPTGTLGGRRFDPLIRQYSFMEIGPEIISTAILSLPLIQVGQLSVTGGRICTKYWLTT